MRHRLKDAIRRVGNLVVDADVQRRIADYEAEGFNMLAAAARELHVATHHRDPRRLLPFGYKGYSQGDEDGIIDEIFRRIGTTTRFFVEFGAGVGLESNTAALLLAGWRGAWLEGSQHCVASIQRAFEAPLRSGALGLRQAFITAENVESLFAELEVPDEPDLLSIDVDFNDYWIWRAIERYRPRVVVIEYNAAFGRSARCVVPYRPDAAWDGTSYYGASLAALEQLGREKGYALVGCCYQGTNAFFVRDDALGEHFCPPYTAANHFQPVCYSFSMVHGHPPGWGELQQV